MLIDKSVDGCTNPERLSSKHHSEFTNVWPPVSAADSKVKHGERPIKKNSQREKKKKIIPFLPFFSHAINWSVYCVLPPQERTRKYDWLKCSYTYGATLYTTTTCMHHPKLQNDWLPKVHRTVTHIFMRPGRPLVEWAHNLLYSSARKVYIERARGGSNGTPSQE